MEAQAPKGLYTLKAKGTYYYFIWTKDKSESAKSASTTALRAYMSGVGKDFEGWEDEGVWPPE